MLTITVDDYTISTIDGDPHGWPFPWQGSGAKITERLEIAGDTGTWCGLKISHRDRPVLELVIKYPSEWWKPGVLLVPESKVVFLEVSGRIYIYDLEAGLQIAYERIDFPSWWWHREGDTVLLVAELDLMAWDISGRKLWSTDIEPPHDVTVRDGVVHVDAFSFARWRKQGRWRFPIRSGPDVAIMESAPSA